MILKYFGEPAYRPGQIYSALFRLGIGDLVSADRIRYHVKKKNLGSYIPQDGHFYIPEKNLPALIDDLNIPVDAEQLRNELPCF